MKKTIIIVTTLLVFFTGVQTIESQNKPEMTVPDMVTYYADMFGVDQKLAHYIAEHESQYNPLAVGDMNITCPRTGKPVRARGIFQVTECWYPHITDEMAFDAETNIYIAMQVIAKGEKTCRQQFSTCNNYYGRIR